MGRRKAYKEEHEELKPEPTARLLLRWGAFDHAQKYTADTSRRLYGFNVVRALAAAMTMLRYPKGRFRA